MASPRTPENNITPPPFPKVRKQKSPSACTPSDFETSEEKKITNYVQAILEDVMIDYQVLLKCQTHSMGSYFNSI